METQKTENVQIKIETIVQLLKSRGMQYQDIIAGQSSSQYDFIFPNSPYYQTYISELAKINNEQSENQQQNKQNLTSLTYQGNIEEIPVGAMTQIIRSEIRNGHQPYRPLQTSVYQHKVDLDLKDPRLNSKIFHLIDKHEHLTKKVTKPQENKTKNAPEKTDKTNQLRRQLGTNPDGSMGGFGGKKYQGLGTHDQFSQYRREQSQQYYSNLQQKHRQN